MRVEVYKGHAYAAIKNKQEPEYIGTIVDFDGGVDADGDRYAIVRDEEGFLNSIWLGRLRAVPATAPVNKK